MTLILCVLFIIHCAYEEIINKIWGNIVLFIHQMDQFEHFKQLSSVKTKSIHLHCGPQPTTIKFIGPNLRRVFFRRV
jgi:hypothetical protein